jgi:hypothetical protein
LEAKGYLYTLFRNCSHTDRKNDNFGQQMVIKESPQEAKEWIKKWLVNQL